MPTSPLPRHEPSVSFSQEDMDMDMDLAGCFGFLG